MMRDVVAQVSSSSFIPGISGSHGDMVCDAAHRAIIAVLAKGGRDSDARSAATGEFCRIRSSGQAG
jgi:hypothetical protein